MNLSPMDYVRGAISSAIVEDMTLADLWAAAEHAETCDAFDEAVNVLAQTIPTEQEQ